MASNVPPHVRPHLKLRAWQLMTEGRTQAEIAFEVSGIYPGIKVGQSTVSRWITAESRRAVAQLDDTAATAIAAAIAQLRRQISESWLAWERSKNPKKEGTQSTVNDKKTTRTKVTEREGNPVWLAEHRASIEALCRLLQVERRFAPAPPAADDALAAGTLAAALVAMAERNARYVEPAAPATPPPEPASGDQS